jgi:hypothetical protein
MEISAQAREGKKHDATKKEVGNLNMIGVWKIE